MTNAPGHLVLGSRTIPILAARLSLSAGDENFVLYLETAGDGVSKRIDMFGYCEPRLPGRDAVADCVLWTAVEDGADVFELDIDGETRTIGPINTTDDSVVLRVEILDDAHVTVRYRGTFLSVDPAGVEEEELLDVDLHVVARWSDE
jgi:hypothetical protein